MFWVMIAYLVWIMVILFGMAILFRNTNLGQQKPVSVHSRRVERKD